jgi:RHS repeat-associated protein
VNKARYYPHSAPFTFARTRLGRTGLLIDSGGYEIGQDPTRRLITNQGEVTGSTEPGHQNACDPTLAVEPDGALGAVWESNDRLFLALHHPVTKHYYAAGRLIATRHNDELYYVQADPFGSTTLFTDQGGEAVGVLRYSPMGTVISNTLPARLNRSLVSHLEPNSGLQYDGQRYYDPWVGGYIQPDPVGGAPGAPQGLNRYAAVPAASPNGASLLSSGAGLPPLVVNAFESIASNTASEVISNRWLEPVAGRLIGHAASWHWLNIYQSTYVRSSQQVPLLISLLRHRVEFGPFRLQSIRSDLGGLRYNLVAHRLPGDFDDLTRSLSRRGVSVIERSIGSRLGWWNSSFGLNKLSSEVAEHFTAGGFVAGGVVDAVIGGALQYYYDSNDPMVMAAIANDPSLRWRRVSAAAGANATIGLGATAATAGTFAYLVGAGYLAATPPGWVIVGTTIAVAAILDVAVGDFVKEDIWFRLLDAN